MNRGTSPAETRSTLRRSGCQGLLLGIAVSLVVLTACQAQAPNGAERAASAQRTPPADPQAVGTFDRLAGEYRGTSKGDAFVVWVDALPAVEAGQQAAAGERKGRLNDLYRVWTTQGGLILLLDFQGVRLPPDWEEIEGGDYPPYLRNQEYIVWQGREYAIRRIRRSAGTGALESVQLTQTGFIQKFFDNR